MALKLTVKQEKFCNKYLECGNASEAYRFAYNCGKMTDKQIWEEASKLLSNPKVAQRIAELQSRLQKKSDITKEAILEDLNAIREATIADYVEFNGSTLRYKDFKTLTSRQLKAVESIKMTANGIELKLHGKSWTIERICKMLGYDAPAQSEVRITNEFEHMTDDEIQNFISNAEGEFD